MTSERKTSLWAWAKPYRGRFALGALMLVATNLLGYTVPKLTKTAIDSLVERSPGTPVDMGLLTNVAIAVFIVAILQACVRIASRLLVFNAGRDIEGDLRHGLFSHILAWAPERLRAHPLGDLQSRMLNDLTNVRLLFGVGLLNVINTTIAYAVALPLMWSENPKLLLVSLTPYPVMIALMVLVAKRVFKHGVEAGERLGEVSNLINEDLGARMYVTASGLQRVQQQRYANANDRYLVANLSLVRTRAMMFPIMAALASLGTALALLYGGGLVLRGEMTLGSLVAFTSYLTMLSFPTMMFGFMLAVIQRGRAAWNRVSSLIDEPAWVNGTKRVDTESPELKLTGIDVRRGEKTVLHGLSLTIPFGERLGIVGEVGSGKTTLLQVLARLIETEPGTYRIGGTSANELSTNEVRALLGVVPQQPFLFSMSVRDNVALGAPMASTQEIDQALDRAQIQEEMLRLPEALQTEIGERGITLSGGQKQRLALARALLPHPKILLLDDSFSAVDVETERRIIEKLVSMKEKQTVVIATHRLAVLDYVDRIIVLKDGLIVEEGAPNELKSRAGSRYRSLYERQQLAETLGEVA
jgi:ATP-binding cassette, subfamily B, multidrug efflux pump